MSNETDFVWEFSCPKFVDFTDAKALDLNAEEADKYFESEHEFSFNGQNLSECLKVESILANAETMTTTGYTPNRPGSSSSNYRTPECKDDDLEADEVFYTTRKSYSLRETECRRLTQIGASPYRIPGGTTTGKKKSRRTPFQPKLIEENEKQIEEEELLVKNLAKALFIDNEETESTKEKSICDKNGEKAANKEKENSPVKKRTSKPKLTESIDIYCEELKAPKNVVTEEQESDSIETEANPPVTEQIPAESTEVHSVEAEKQEELNDLSSEPSEAVTSFSTEDTFISDSSKKDSISPKAEEASIESNDTPLFLPSNPETQTSDEKLITNSEKLEQTPSEVSFEKKEEIVLAEEDKTSTVDSRENTSPKSEKSSCSTQSSCYKSSVETCSDENWTDADEEQVIKKPGAQEKQRRPLRRESFVKSSATLASTAKKVDPQKRLYRLLSYTAPPRNKFRSLAELSRDFEQKIRIYTPPSRKSNKSHWTPTKPISPKLTACKRNRTLTCVSHTQQEENIAQSIKKNTFKATPFNKKTYLSTVNVGVKRVDPKPITKPIPFSFRSEKRIQARRSRLPADLFNKLTTDSKTTK